MDVDGAPSFSKHLVDLKGDLNCLAEIPKVLLGRSNHTFPAVILGIVDKQKPFSEEKAKKLRSLRDRLQQQLTELLGDDGILLFPSFPTPAPFHHQPLLTPFNFAYTALWNTLALPVVECPMGLNDDGVPVGVQAIGAPNSDNLLIGVATDLEEGFGGWKPLQNPQPSMNHF
uniref:Amidase domain-containing protein n=1 Tax=Steinernema glaseri TaxID=37863 RepID=A0A1I7Y2P4_9BILA